MKIFEWIHRKMHPSMDHYNKVSHSKDLCCSDTTWSQFHDSKSKQNVADATEVIELHRILDGILTIGTLGESPAYDEEVFCNHEFDVDVPVREPEHQEGRDKDHFKIVKEEEDLVEPFLNEKNGGGGERERTTLAELFVDSDEREGSVARMSSGLGCRVLRRWGKEALPVRRKEKDELPARSWQCGNDKEMLPMKAGGERPPGCAPESKKLRRLIDKMTRKKIHPDVDHESHATPCPDSEMKVYEKQSRKSKRERINGTSTSLSWLFCSHDLPQAAA